jgi:ABC-type branched-subunit amino acid transport system ATPase component
MIAVQNGQHAAPWWKHFCDWIGGRSSVDEEAPVPMAPGATASLASSTNRVDADRAGIEVQALTVRYGGNTAVREVTLRAPMGQITGLIGPNGAGKTTIFNTCSGLVRQSAGTIRLHGEDVSKLTPSARAQRGLGRTFQRMELFDSLTVQENVALGREASLAGNRPWRHLLTASSERRQLDEATTAAVEWCGIQHLLTKQAGQLSTGQRRLVELARTLAGKFDVLLLDEPSSGLDGGETERFGEVLTRVVSERGVGILLVEHDMALVMSVCDYIYVLDFGAQIFDGTPGEVARSEAVRAAYLGSEDVLDVVREPRDVIV